MYRDPVAAYRRFIHWDRKAGPWLVAFGAFMVVLSLALIIAEPRPEQRPRDFGYLAIGVSTVAQGLYSKRWAASPRNRRILERMEAAMARHRALPVQEQLRRELRRASYGLLASSLVLALGVFGVIYYPPDLRLLPFVLLAFGIILAFWFPSLVVLVGAIRRKARTARLG